MRMWMTDPKHMCRQHLLGEHRELHTLVAHLKRKRSIAGYVANNCLEPLSINTRHDALVKEMERRGYNHKSPLGFSKRLLSYLPNEHRHYKVDEEASKKDLFGRCKACSKENDHRQRLEEEGWELEDGVWYNKHHVITDQETRKAFNKSWRYQRWGDGFGQWKHPNGNRENTDGLREAL